MKERGQKSLNINPEWLRKDSFGPHGGKQYFVDSVAGTQWSRSRVQRREEQKIGGSWKNEAAETMPMGQTNNDNQTENYLLTVFNKPDTMLDTLHSLKTSHNKVLSFSFYKRKQARENILFTSDHSAIKWQKQNSKPPLVRCKVRTNTLCHIMN